MKVAVVGAGVGGLAAAYDLARAGNQVTVLEANDYVGGLSAGFKQPGWDWSVEHYYHHWFASDKHMLALIDELGLTQKVRFKSTVTAVYHEGKFYGLDSIPAVLRFPGFNLIDLARFGLATAYLRFTPSWKPLEKHTAAGWIRRWYGERTYRTLWQPLLQGKFGPHHKEVNMAWFWARVHARTKRLGTYVGGFQAFADDLAEAVRGLGVDIRLHSPVDAIQPRAAGGIRLRVADMEHEYDQCLVTTSPALLARLTPALPETYLKQLLDLKSMGAVVMILALAERLSESGIYWHNLPKSAGFPFLALVEHTNYLSPEYFAGDHLVYCGDYLDPGHEYFRLSKEELLERFIPGLERFNPHFRRDWIKNTWMFRTAYAQPVPPVNHSKSIPDLRTPIDGLWLACMSQVYPWDRGTNFAVEVARRAAGLMLATSDKAA